MNKYNPDLFLESLFHPELIDLPEAWIETLDITTWI